ncbi:hypothetical protein [Sorangium atrum]|uniref:Fibronectin type-III domain-containing protein n=1 Tax=Sorangium atrum TaxID=2995308 RepID=A0ABT5CEW2_9BACT|nr:hypothetical protein [Sorangium aterium]MDC0684483.1 hypothetical protein [Sorangium aterium]
MARSTFAYLAALGIAAALAACGDSSTEDASSTTTAGAGGMGGMGGMDGAGGSTSATGGGGGETAAPEAPVLEMVMPMDGVLHVEWSTPAPCDEIEGERKDPMHEYEVAFTVAGTKTSRMDAGAFEDLEYTYRLRCKVGEVYSDYSNEMSGNPTEE